MLVDGIAASAASYIAAIGREVIMGEGAMQMIHDAWSITIGNSDVHRAAGDVLDTISEGIVGAYVAKSGRSREDVREMMRSETWFTADGAIAYGLADAKLGADGEVIPGKRAKATTKIAALQSKLDRAVAQLARI